MLPAMTTRQVSTHAADTLRTRILDGTYPAGSRLPGERMLSQQMAVSRTALRDALRTLEATGFVEMKAGQGRYVSSAGDVEGSTAALSWLLLHRHDLESLNEVRQLLEPAAVAGTPPEATKDLAARLSRIVDDQMRAVVTEQFHVASGECARDVLVLGDGLGGDPPNAVNPRRVDPGHGDQLGGQFAQW